MQLRVYVPAHHVHQVWMPGYFSLRNSRHFPPALVEASCPLRLYTRPRFVGNPVTHHDTGEGSINLVAKTSRQNVAVIQQYFQPRGFKFLVQLFADLQDLPGFFCIDGNDGDTEGSKRLGPAYALLVKVLFNGGGDHTRDPDTITTHRHNLFAPVLVQYTGLECGAVLVAQLENVADFNPSLDGD